MGKTQKNIWITEDIWVQFQVLYPRQASSMIEDWMTLMIDRKIEKIADDSELQSLMEAAADQKKAMQEASSALQKVQAQIQQYQMEKRRELAEKKAKQRDRIQRAKVHHEAVRASGILERFDVS